VSASVLLFAIAGGSACTVVTMPQDSDPLPAATIDLIRRWVCAGAPGP
jgi:hypothetical protein